MEAVEPLSLRAYQVAGEYNLGQPRAEFNDKRSFLQSSSIKLLASGVAVVYLSQWVLLPYNPTSGMRDMIMFGEGVGILSILCGLLSAGFEVKRWVRGAPCFYLCEGGLVIATAKHIKKVLFWKDMADVQRQIMISVEDIDAHEPPEPCGYRFVLITKARKRYIFDDILGSLLSHSFTEALWPETLERYLAGQVLVFGELALNTEGLRHNPERLLPWRKVEMPWIDEMKDTLVISRSDDAQIWATVPLSRMLQAGLCLKLIDYALQNTVRSAEE